MKILTLTEESKTDILENLLKRSPNSYGKFESQVAEIIENVRAKKDAALFDYTRRFDGADISADEIFVSDGAKSDSGNIGDIFSVDNKIAVCDPVYPVYVDTNAMAGRTGD